MQVHQQILASILSGTLVFTPLDGYALTSPAQASPPAAQAQPIETNQDLPSLVAPIALYPDALIAQILGASTYPTQVVEADRWLKQNSSLSGDALAKAVDQQSWDPSVKALTQFPSVLDNMSQNLSWTSALGDAYFNDQQDVMDTVQDLRARAKQAGSLQSNSQQTVTTEGQTIVIQPAQPQVVYVPTYNPTVVYGAPVPMYYGYAPYYPSTGAVVAASVLSFGVGIAVGAAISGGWGWGWNSWAPTGMAATCPITATFMFRAAIPSSTATIITAGATTIVRTTTRATVPIIPIGPATAGIDPATLAMAGTDQVLRVTEGTGLAMGATIPAIAQEEGITIRAMAGTDPAMEETIPVIVQAINPVAAIIGRAETATGPRRAPRTLPIVDMDRLNRATSREPSTATTREGLPVSRASVDNRA